MVTLQLWVGEANAHSKVSTPSCAWLAVRILCHWVWREAHIEETNSRQREWDAFPLCYTWKLNYSYYIYENKCTILTYFEEMESWDHGLIKLEEALEKIESSVLIDMFCFCVLHYKMYFAFWWPFLHFLPAPIYPLGSDIPVFLRGSHFPLSVHTVWVGMKVILVLGVGTWPRLS